MLRRLPRSTLFPSATFCRSLPAVTGVLLRLPAAVVATRVSYWPATAAAWGGELHTSARPSLALPVLSPPPQRRWKASAGRFGRPLLAGTPTPPSAPVARVVS